MTDSGRFEQLGLSTDRACHSPRWRWFLWLAAREQEAASLWNQAAWGAARVSHGVLGPWRVGDANHVASIPS